MKIEGCRAIVTGGASGLGEACVRSLAELGAYAAILDMASERGNMLAGSLGNNVIFCQTDVCSEESVQDAIDKAVEAFGGVDVAISCAGVADPGKVLSKKGILPLTFFNKVIQINLVGTFNVLRLASQKMLANTPSEDGERGVVINTASIAAFDGQVGQAAYSSSKAGIVGMTLPVAREFADHGIRVLAVAPGIFKTPMIASMPQEVQDSLGNMIPFPRRLGKPEEYAALVRHIIENPMLNGEVIRLDGAVRMAAR